MTQLPKQIKGIKVGEGGGSTAEEEKQQNAMWIWSGGRTGQQKKDIFKIEKSEYDWISDDVKKWL